MPCSQQPKILLFDLGGVIVPWTGLQGLCDLSGLSQQALSERLKGLSAWHAFEVGACEFDVFAAAIIDALSLDITADVFRQQWNDWVHPPYPGTQTMLRALKGRYGLACLSNTNMVHWDHIMTLLPLTALLDQCFASHLIGAAKPGHAAFAAVMDHLRADNDLIEPCDVWFFDDMAVNIEAAQAFGFKAFQVDPDYGVIPVLQTCGLYA